MSSNISKYNLSASFKPQNVQKENAVLQQQIKEEEDETSISYDNKSSKLSKRPISANPQGVKKFSFQDDERFPKKSMPLPTAPETSSTESVKSNFLCSVCSKSLTVGGNWKPYKLSDWEKPICLQCKEISLNPVKDNSDEPACAEVSCVSNKDCTGDPNSAEVSRVCNKDCTDDQKSMPLPTAPETSSMESVKSNFLCSVCSKSLTVGGNWKPYKLSDWEKPICLQCKEISLNPVKDNSDEPACAEVSCVSNKDCTGDPNSAEVSRVCNKDCTDDRKSMPLPTAPETSSTESVKSNFLCSVCSKSLTVGGNWKPYKLADWEKPICLQCKEISLNPVKDNSDEPACAEVSCVSNKDCTGDANSAEVSRVCNKDCTDDQYSAEMSGVCNKDFTDDQYSAEMSGVCNKDCTDDPNSAAVSPDCNQSHIEDCYRLFYDPEIVERSLDFNEDSDYNRDYYKDTYLTCSKCNNPFKLEGSWRAYKPKNWSTPICWMCSRKSFLLGVRGFIPEYATQTNPVQPQKKAAKKNHDNSSYVCSKCKKSFNIEGKEETSKLLKSKKPVCAACTKKPSGLKRKSSKAKKMIKNKHSHK
ncbi:uncharacterized protein LOC118188265 isoform X2 [Stegodyphus dumicola]|uniref:uncharacterized protein LOC118188265 isoform X2 n=1 Tax=Stegodyphus dumicola TaxID=202533 RepID=UPI0015AD89AD|nr:uncharacterized protein LOC118188265 isoform X2 [Stegodyphus dumicola]